MLSHRIFFKAVKKGFTSSDDDLINPRSGGRWKRSHVCVNCARNRHDKCKKKIEVIGLHTIKKTNTQIFKTSWVKCACSTCKNKKSQAK